jgi:hypothetical protein
MKWTFGVLLVAACRFTQAAEVKSQAPQDVCERLSAAVEDGVKELSQIRVDGLTDDSAPRETNRQLEKVITTNLMQMHLTLMQANKCTLPKTTFYDTAYYTDALSCATARLKARADDKETPPDCVRSKWTRMWK